MPSQVRGTFNVVIEPDLISHMLVSIHLLVSSKIGMNDTLPQILKAGIYFSIRKYANDPLFKDYSNFKELP